MLIHFYRVLSDTPILGGARRGDLILYQPQDPDMPFVLQRNLPLADLAALSQVGQFEHLDSVIRSGGDAVYTRVSGKQTNSSRPTPRDPHRNGWEDCAHNLLHRSQWREFDEKRRRRLQRWPKKCRDCGDYFEPVTNVARVRCDSCLERRRAER